MQPIKHLFGKHKKTRNTNSRSQTSLFSDRTSSISLTSKPDIDSETEATDEQIRKAKADLEVEEYLEKLNTIAVTCVTKNDKEGALSAYQDAVLMAKTMKDKRKLIWAQRNIGEIYMKFNDIRNAIMQFEIEKNFAEQNTLYVEKMHAYQRLGKCHQLLRNYKEALICFKKMLELAWENNLRAEELLAYDFIAMQYYYLGDVERSAYYHDRMVSGKYEAKTSPARALAKTTLNQRRQNRSVMPTEGKDKLHTSISAGKFRGERNFLNSSFVELTELPSPRASSGFSKSVRIMPYTISHEERAEAQKTKHTSSLPTLHHMPIVRTTAKTQRFIPGVKPFVLLTHLSTNRSINNLYYFTQMNSRIPRREEEKSARG